LKALGWGNGAARAVLAVLVSFALAATVAAHGHPPRHTRHYLGGWTRTTWYVPYSPPNRTASGVWPRWGMLAAPSWIPFGAHVVIPGLGVFTVQDRGGDIVGDHLDIFLDYPGEHHVADWYQGVFWFK
jgi:hypothetical protein